MDASACATTDGHNIVAPGAPPGRSGPRCLPPPWLAARLAAWSPRCSRHCGARSPRGAAAPPCGGAASAAVPHGIAAPEPAACVRHAPLSRLGSGAAAHCAPACHGQPAHHGPDGDASWRAASHGRRPSRAPLLRAAAAAHARHSAIAVGTLRSTSDSTWRCMVTPCWMPAARPPLRRASFVNNCEARIRVDSRPAAAQTTLSPSAGTRPGSDSETRPARRPTPSRARPRLFLRIRDRDRT